MPQRSSWQRLVRRLPATSLSCEALESRLVPASVVRTGSGANAAAIQAVVDSFRTDLGGGTANANVAGSFLAGRREINWDGVPDTAASPNTLPADFFNTTSPRGVVFAGPTASPTFRVSANSTNTTSTPVRFGDLNAAYATSFTTFSPQRLFTRVGNNVTDVSFFVPGTMTPATVSGFGAVFTDVDNTSATTIQLFSPGGTSLGVFTALAFNNGLSFLGVSFNAGERVGRVLIMAGNVAVTATASPNDVDGAASASDVVVMDDFIYGEPRAQPDVLAVDATSNALVRFNAATPGTVISTTPVVGLVTGESLAGIDYRPANGQLYGLVVNGTSARLVTVNTATGQLTQVGAAFTVSGTNFGFNFNPVADRIRVVSDADINLSVNPADGTVTAQTALNPGNPNVVAAAYTNSLPGAATTTLFDIDSGTDSLLTQNPPASGTLTTVGALGVDTSGVAALDIEGGTNTALAVLTVGSTSGLYAINTVTGAATSLGPVGASLSLKGLAIVPAPSFTITPAVSVVEGNSGTTPVSATVSIVGDIPAGQPVTVRVATANGTALAGTDYTALASTTLTFTNNTPQTVTTTVLGNTLNEPDKTFTFNLSQATGALIAGRTSTVTITNDDAQPSLSVNDVTVTEGNSGTSNAVFTVTLSAASGQTVTVVATVRGVTATAGSDFTAVGPFTLTFAPGVTTQTVTVPIVGDTIAEPTETFNVVLSAPTNAALGKATGVGTILDNDAGAGTPGQCYVGQLFRDLLGREADAGGLAFFAAAIDRGGATRGQVAEAIESSQEYRVRALEALYQRYLGRSLDGSGRTTWLAFLADNNTLEGVAVRVIGSSEYLAKAGGSNDRFLQQVYTDALRRTIDASGQASWGAELASGRSSRADVAAAILASAESNRLEVTDLYSAVLRRTPDGGGLDGFAAFLNGGGSDETVRARLLASDEYFARFCRPTA